MTFYPAASLDDDPIGINRASRALTWLVIAVTCGITVARILTCHAPDPNRPVPFMSANDRSRWCTVRSLVDYGTIAIDPVIEGANGKWWDTIDKVRHVGPDGQMHFYSSKPVLWPTFLAGQYWLLQRLTGWTLESKLFEVVRTMLIANNVVALMSLIWFCGRMAEMLSSDLRTRMYISIAAGLGTYLTPFAITLNNHLPAACLVAISLWLALRIQREPSAWISYFLLGLTAALAATLELPATGWLAVCCSVALFRSIPKTVVGFAPSVLIVAAAFWGANYWAHQEWKPPYAHRTDGPAYISIKGDFESELDAGVLPDRLIEAHNSARDPFLPAVNSAAIVERREGNVAPSPEKQWLVNPDTPGQFIVQKGPVEGVFQLHSWNNWYDYPGSYWRSDNRRKSTIDVGEPNQLKYLAHLTIGHHGVLSLSPLFLLSLIGVLPLCLAGRFGARYLALATLALTAAVAAFYVSRPEVDRNYGGMTCAARWMLWLVPLWLMWMAPALEFCGRRRWLWFVAAVLLAASVASASYAIDNPWVHPWLYEWMSAQGLQV